MAAQYLNDLDLNGNQLIELCLEHLTSDPTAMRGRIFLRSDTGNVRFSPDGSVFTNLLTPAAALAYRLDQFAAPTGPIDFNGQAITNYPTATPQNDSDLVTKAYADTLRAGLQYKDAVVAMSTGVVNLSTPGTTLDGVTLSVGDRILLTGNGANNGIYQFNGAGTLLTRTTDANSSSKLVSGTVVWVNSGTTYGDTRWVLVTDGVINPGTTVTSWTQDGGLAGITPGNGLNKTGNTIYVVPGFGILADGSSTRIDSSVIPQKKSFTIGDGTNTSYTITHNLGTQDLSVTIRQTASPYQLVQTDVFFATNNTISLLFAVAPANNAYRVTIIG